MGALVQQAPDFAAVMARRFVRGVISMGAIWRGCVSR